MISPNQTNRNHAGGPNRSTPHAQKAAVHYKCRAGGGLLVSGDNRGHRQPTPPGGRHTLGELGRHEVGLPRHRPVIPGVVQGEGQVVPPDAEQVAGGNAEQGTGSGPRIITGITQPAAIFCKLGFVSCPSGPSMVP